MQVKIAVNIRHDFWKVFGDRYIQGDRYIEGRYTPNSKKVALGIGNWALESYCLGIRKQ